MFCAGVRRAAAASSQSVWERSPSQVRDLCCIEVYWTLAKRERRMLLFLVYLPRNGRDVFYDVICSN